MSDMSRIAALLGDPARANILMALFDGRALTAKELAFAAHVSPQTTSGHLAKLTDAQLLTVERQGRHRYFRLSSPLVGQMMESVMAVASNMPAAAPRPWRGRRGVAHGPDLLRPPCRAAWRRPGRFADRWRVPGVVPGRWRGHRAGDVFLAHLVRIRPPGKRVFCRPCLDWSERRPHIAGRLGAAIRRPMPFPWLAAAASGHACGNDHAGGQRGFADVFGISGLWYGISGGLLLPGAPRTAPIAYAATASASLSLALVI